MVQTLEAHYIKPKRAVLLRPDTPKARKIRLSNAAHCTKRKLGPKTNNLKEDIECQMVTLTPMTCIYTYRHIYSTRHMYVWMDVYI